MKNIIKFTFLASCVFSDTAIASSRNHDDSHENQGYSLMSFQPSLPSVFQKNEASQVSRAPTITEQDIQRGLWRAAETNNVALFKAKVEYIKNINFQSKCGWTLLHTASIEGHKEIIEELVKNNVGINIQNNRGETALYLAVMHGHYDAVQTLLEHNANPNITNNSGVAALSEAIHNGRYEIIDELLKYNTDVECKDEHGRTPLLKACGPIFVMHKPIDTSNIVESLIRQKANVHFQDKDGNTPLHNAVYWEKPNIVKMLVEKTDVNINVQDKDGQTPLHYAAGSGFEDISEILIAMCADTSIQDKNGQTPFDLDSKGSLPQIMNFYIAHGPNLQILKEEVYIKRAR